MSLPAKEAFRLTTDLLVVPTSRARRERYAAANGLPRKILTMDEFESRLAVAPGRALIDETTRLLLLREASRFDSYEKLGIPRDFLVFLEHAPFFLRFFDELSGEGVQPDALLKGDSYAEYDEHIAVLKTLQKNYRALLDAKGYADRALLYETCELNLPWLRQFDRVEVVIEGALSRFERTLLDKAAAVVPLTLTLELSPFDQKTADAFLPLALKTGHLCRADLSAQTLLETTPIKRPETFRLYGVKERLQQAGAIQQAVFELVDRGFAPERIVVVLPDESFAPILRRFDRHRIFNFAMGFSFEQSDFYRTLSGFYERLIGRETAQKLRFERLCKTHETLAALSAPFFENPTRQNGSALFERLQTLSALADETEKEIAAEALFELKPILAEEENLLPAEALHLFLQTLKTKSLDDISGGAVTVMGVLETRSAHFDAVIVADFNEGFAPKESVKDMFLSARVREEAGLPTRADRADLQRALYWRLFARAKERVIFCVVSDTVKPSRFLKELGIRQNPEPFAAVSALLFTPKTILRQPEKEIEGSFDLTQKPLSASAFKSYLTCKRQFYYRSLARLKSDGALEAPAPMQEIGTRLHAALAECFKDPFADAAELKHRIVSHLKSGAAPDARLAFEAALWERKIDRFCQNEAARRKEGWQPFLFEAPLSATYNGVILTGRIDRADRRSGEVLVLDYKSGKIPEFKNPERHTDFQLIFYRLLLLAQGHGAVEAGYYGLEEGAIALLENPEPFLAAFEARLEAFKAPYHRFVKCESHAPCRACEFQILCGRAS